MLPPASWPSLGSLARVFVTRGLPGPALDRLAERHQVEIWPGRLPPSQPELAQRVVRAEGLLTLLTDAVDARLLDGAPELRAVANYAVGVDNIDLAACAARGIAVGNTPGVLTEATADLAFALLLGCARRLNEAERVARGGDWVTWEPQALLGAEVHGATLGIVGYGRIGRAVARRAAGFSMRVLHGTLDEVLEQSDFVSLHVPLRDTTRGLIGAAELTRMKPTAFLINTSRGPVVDQAALIDALHRGEIAGAALDVTDPEPPVPGDPVLRAPNLLLVPHIGSATRAARERMAEMAVANLLAALDGDPMPHPVRAPPPRAPR